MPTTYTPLRFPGGKTKIYPLVEAIIDANGLDGCIYGEGFCGGAGLAMKLLLKGKVSEVVLNDADPAIFSIWSAVVNDTAKLCDFISEVPLDISEWKRQREVYTRSDAPSLELGKAAFYLNRTNRSGMLEGGVIGGMEQKGSYKLDARFNRKNLIAKVARIGELSDKIALHNLDISDFLYQEAPKLGDAALLYLDPPYVAKGPGLYKSSFDDEKHRRLVAEVRSYSGKWMLTYDNDPLVRELYVPDSTWPITVDSVTVGYSAASTRTRAEEFLALGPGLTLPKGEKR